MNNELRKKTIKNLIYSFTAQITSVLLSTLMSLCIPKILGVTDYGYWQLFLFYINYVGFFHFGITDGMYLKNGGMDYSRIDKRELAAQFYVLLFLQLLLLGIVIIFSIGFISGSIRKVILIFSAIYMIVANMNWYLGYVFQATNRVKLYSISVMIDKLIFLVFIIFAFLFNIRNLITYIVVYIFTTFCALLFSIYNSKEIITSKPYEIKKSLKISFESAKVGINLTLASVSSLLILGVGRYLVDKAWGIESFGKFSFSLSLTNFFLLFISQISVVLFPTLRQINKSVAKNLYTTFTNYLDAILPVIYILYVPIKLILILWLPQYSVSLNYLVMLLPICIFDGKTQMINNTYFKVFRMEKEMLKLNLMTVLVSTLLSLFSVFIIKNINFVILGMLFAICFRSIVGESILSKKLNIKNNLANLLFEILLSAIFIAINMKLDCKYALWTTLLLYLAYLYITKLYKVYSSILKKFIKKIGTIGSV